MAGIIDAVSQFVNPSNLINAGLSGALTATKFGTSAGLSTAGLQLGFKALSAGLTPRPNTGTGITNALNTYSSPPQQSNIQPTQTGNLGNILQTIGDNIVSRIETTNALLQKLIDVQTGREDIDYRKKATQYGRLAQSLSRSAMGRIFLTVMGKALGNASADLQYATKNALQAGVTNQREIFTSKLLSEIPIFNKYFRGKFDELSKNILRIQSAYTKETDMTINKIIPDNLKAIGQLVHSHMNEHTTHLKVISHMSIEIRDELTNFKNNLSTILNNQFDIIKNQSSFFNSIENSVQQTMDFISKNVGQLIIDTKHHYTEVERILNRSYVLLSNTLPQLVGAVDQINTRDYANSKIKDPSFKNYSYLKSTAMTPWVDKYGNFRGLNGDSQNANIHNFIKHYIDNRFPQKNNKGAIRTSNDYDKDTITTTNLSFKKLDSTISNLTNAISDKSGKNLLVQAQIMALDQKSKNSGLSLFDCMNKVIDQQKETAIQNSKDQKSLMECVNNANTERQAFLSTLSNTASSILSSMISLKSSFLMFSMNLPNLLTRTLSSIIKVGIGMFLGRQLIGLLARVFTGSTNSIGKEGFIGTLWHDGIFSAIMYAKDKIAGYLGDALNWVFKAITGKESFKAAVDEYYEDAKNKVWNYIIDSLPTIIKYIFLGITTYKFATNALMPLISNIYNGVIGFIPNIFEGIHGGLSAWGAHLNKIPIFKKVSKKYTELLDWFGNSFGEWGTSLSDTVASTMQGHIRGPIKILSDKIGTGITRSLLRRIYKGNDEALEIINNSPLKRANINFLTDQVQESQKDSLNKFSFKFLTTFRKIFGFQNLDKNDGWLMKGFKAGGSFSRLVLSIPTNILSMTTKGLFSVFSTMFQSLVKNPFMFLQVGSFLSKFVTMLYDSIMNSMFNKKQLELMSTSEKTYEFIKWVIVKIKDIFISTFETIWEFINPANLWKVAKGVWNGIWDGLFTSSNNQKFAITAIVDEKSIEELKNENEKLRNVVDTAIPKPDKGGKTIFERINDKLGEISKKISESIEAFFLLANPENLAYAKTKFINTMRSIFKYFGADFSEQEKAEEAERNKTWNEGFKDIFKNKSSINELINSTTNKEDKEALKKLLYETDENGNIIEDKLSNRIAFYDDKGNFKTFNVSGIDNLKNRDLLLRTIYNMNKAKNPNFKLTENEFRAKWGESYAVNRESEIKNMETYRDSLEQDKVNKIGSIEQSTKGILKYTLGIYNNMLGTKQFNRQLTSSAAESDRIDKSVQEHIDKKKNTYENIPINLSKKFDRYDNTNKSGSIGRNMIRENTKFMKELNISNRPLITFSEEEQKNMLGEYYNVIKKHPALQNFTLPKIADFLDSYINTQETNKEIDENIISTFFDNRFNNNLKNDPNINNAIKNFLISQGYKGNIDTLLNSNLSDLEILIKNRYSKEFVEFAQKNQNLSELTKDAKLDNRKIESLKLTYILKNLYLPRDKHNINSLLNAIGSLKDNSITFTSNSGSSYRSVLPNSAIANKFREFINAYWTNNQELQNTYENQDEWLNREYTEEYIGVLPVVDTLYRDLNDISNKFMKYLGETEIGENGWLNKLKDNDEPLQSLLSKGIISSIINPEENNKKRFNAFMSGYNPFGKRSTYKSNLDTIDNDLYKLALELAAGVNFDVDYIEDSKIKNDKIQQELNGIISKMYLFSNYGKIIDPLNPNHLMSIDTNGNWRSTVDEGKSIRVNFDPNSAKTTKFFNLQEGEPPYGNWRTYYPNRKYIPFNGEQTWSRYIIEAALETGVDPEIISSIIMAESHGHPDAVNKTGAKGLMQMFPAARTDARRYKGAQKYWEFTNPMDSIFLGTYYLKWILERGMGTHNLFEAVLAYNFGTGNAKSYLKTGKVLPGYENKVDYNYLKHVFQYYGKHRFTDKNMPVSKEIEDVAKSISKGSKISSIKLSSGTVDLNSEEANMARKYLNFSGRSGTLESFMLIRPELRSAILNMARDYYEGSNKIPGVRKINITSAWRSMPYQMMLYNNRKNNKNTVAPPNPLTNTHYLGLAVDMPKDIVNWLNKNNFLTKYGLTQPFPGKDPVHIEPANLRKNGRIWQYAKEANYPLSMQTNGLYMEPGLNMTKDEFIRMSIKYDPFLKNLSGTTFNISGTNDLFSASGVEGSGEENKVESAWNIDLKDIPFMAEILNFKDNIHQKMTDAGLTSSNMGLNMINMLLGNNISSSSQSTGYVSSTPSIPSVSSNPDSNVGEPYAAPKIVKNIVEAIPVHSKFPIPIGNIMDMVFSNDMQLVDYQINKSNAGRNSFINRLVQQQKEQNDKNTADSIAMNKNNADILKVIGNLAMAILQNGGNTNNILTTIANETSNAISNSNTGSNLSNRPINDGDMGLAALQMVF